MVRKLTLEQRIARLEKLLNSKSLKNENKLSNTEVMSAVKDWFSENRYRFGYDVIEAAMDAADDELIDWCCSDLAKSGLGKKVFAFRDLVADTLAGCAIEDEQNEWKDEEDFDDEEELDELDECNGRSCESNKRICMKRKVESKLPRRKVKNEEVDDFASLGMEDSWPYIEQAIENGDAKALNKYAREGNFEHYHEPGWITDTLVKNNSDLATTKAACKIISRIVKSNPDVVLWPSNIKNLNKTDNEYLINFLVNNGFVEDLVNARVSTGYGPARRSKL